jgi:serine protease Do
VNKRIDGKFKLQFFVLALLTTLSICCQPSYGSVTTRENEVVKAVRKVNTAVVNISSQYEIRKNSNPFSVYGLDPMLEKFFNDFFSPEMKRREKRSSLGSGVIIDGDRGFVLTNAHVIEKATKISVMLNDKREFEGVIVGMDPDSDLAVLKIKSDEKLPAIQMGNSDDIMIGESVIAIGNPFGFSHTVTTGVVSAVDRSIKTQQRVFHKFIQTDASINPGNSGGPLLNIDGELIGINTAIYAEAQGIGFAIPINRAGRIVSDLITYGEVVQAWIGLIVQSIDPELAAYLGLNSEEGVIVKKIEEKSPAEEAGFQEGDIIFKIDATPITSITSYQMMIKEISVGQNLLLDVDRTGTKRKIRLKASLFPMEQALKVAENRLGITVAELNQKTRDKYGLKERNGVLILQMTRGSYLERIGVRPGDIIRQMDEVRIDTIDEFKTAMAKYRNKHSVILLIQREGHLYHINAKMKE